jgi:type I restriction enzyme S subunit
VPSKEEQNEVVERLESKISMVEQLEKTIKKELKKSKALRQSILKKAFEGKLIS